MLFERLFRKSPAAPRRMEAGLAVYAVGDVHGRSDLLAPLLAEIAADIERSTADRALVLLLGDLIDRGPDSRGVIEMAMAPGLPAKARLVALKGNHEAALLAAWEDPAALTPWLTFGGDATLASYGVPLSAIPSDPQEMAALQVALQAALPAKHLHFLQAMPVWLHLGDYLFVHAGLLPGRPLSEQREEDLLWIRGPFLESRKDHGALVVHGHDIATAPDIRPNRIGIDTGAYCTEVLTCLRLEGEQRALIQASPQEIRRTPLPP